ncbi:MAG: hypothetical protein KC486_16970 [Myxococcales bacterium]|nr:hypothetical protein [Myxococcales bacterium]
MAISTLATLLVVASPAAQTDAPERSDPGPRLVLGNYYGAVAGVSPWPSFEQTLMIGASLAPRRAAAAVGYSLSITSGLADRYAIGSLTTRHHVTATFAGGRRERLFATLGGGFAMMLILPTSVEIEGRLGLTFAERADRRVVGVFGGMARLGWNVYHRESAPMPQLGLFLGLLLR